MFVKTCTTATHFFSVESTFSALMSGDGKTFETIYNFLKNKLDSWSQVSQVRSQVRLWNQVRFGDKCNQLRNQVEENTITREVSSEIYIPQSFKR